MKSNASTDNKATKTTTQRNSKQNTTKSNSSKLPKVNDSSPPKKSSQPKKPAASSTQKKSLGVLGKLRQEVERKKETKPLVCSASSRLVANSQLIRVSSALKTGVSKEFDPKAEERAKALIREHADKKIRQRAKLEKQRLEQEKQRNLEQMRLNREKEMAARKNSSSARPSSRREELIRAEDVHLTQRQKMGLKQSRSDRDNRSRPIGNKNASLSASRVTGKRPRPSQMQNEPRHKRRKMAYDDYDDEDDEELNDFIVDDDDDYGRFSGRRQRRYNDYYSDDSDCDNMEASFLEIEEEERLSEMHARKLEKQERIREERRQQEKQMRKKGLI